MQLGRYLLSKADNAAPVPEPVFEIVTHFNAARELLAADERWLCVLLNLTAAQRMQRTASWDGAVVYARTAHTLLPDNAWDVDYTLTMRVHLLTGELEFVTGHPDEARAVLDTALAHAKDPYKTSRIVVLRVTQLTLQGNYSAAIEQARVGLRLVGLELPHNNYAEARDAELSRIRELLNGRDLRCLSELPPMTDESQTATMQLLVSMGPPCYRSHPQLWAVIVATEVRLSLQHGVKPSCAYTFPGEMAPRYSAVFVPLTRGLAQPLAAC